MNETLHRRLPAITALRNRSFNALGLGGSTVKALRLWLRATSPKLGTHLAMHANPSRSLDTASEDDELGRTEQEHSRLDDNARR